MAVTLQVLRLPSAAVVIANGRVWLWQIVCHIIPRNNDIYYKVSIRNYVRETGPAETRNGQSCGSIRWPTVIVYSQRDNTIDRVLTTIWCGNASAVYVTMLVLTRRTVSLWGLCSGEMLLRINRIGTRFIFSHNPSWSYRACDSYRRFYAVQNVEKIKKQNMNRTLTGTPRTTPRRASFNFIDIVVVLMWY